MKLIYCTGNKFKLSLAKRILEPLGIEVEGKKLDIPEIQASSIEEVAKYSSKVASGMLKLSTLKNDSGLVIPALNNFPSAYTKYIEETISENGILKLMEGIENREAYFLEVLAYTELGKETVVFVSKTEGKIANKPEGEYGWSFDKIFIPKGESKPMACFSDDERWKFWADNGYKDMAIYLNNTKK